MESELTVQEIAAEQESGKSINRQGRGRQAERERERRQKITIAVAVASSKVAESKVNGINTCLHAN